MSVEINVSGVHAFIEGAEPEHIDGCLSADHPNKQHILAFKEDRWDGKVRLHDAYKRFPAGLVNHVVRYFNELGIDVAVTDQEEMEPIDTSRFTDRYLPGITLRPDQCESIMAFLTHSRGIVKSPTGSGKTEIAAAVCQYYWEERQWRSLIVVPKKGLLDQTAQRLRKYYGTDLRVGELGDSKRFLGPITVATAATLQQFQSWVKKETVRGRKRDVQHQPDPLVRQAVMECNVLMFDECHHASAETWYNVAMKCKANRRFGMSGSPIKNNELDDLRLMGATGDVLHVVESDVLIDAGACAKPRIAVIYSENASGPEMPAEEVPYKASNGEIKIRRMQMPYDRAYNEAIIQGNEHNTTVIRAACWMVDRGRKTVILCRRKEHWRALGERLEETGIEFRAVWGDTEVEERNAIKKQLESGRIKLVLASTVWDEGEDVPGISAMIYAEGIKANTSAVQRVGRGMRRKEGENDVWIVDIVPTSHPTLRDHGMKRVKIWEQEGYEVVPVYEWPAWDDNDYDHDGLLPFLNWEQARAELT